MRRGKDFLIRIITSIRKSLGILGQFEEIFKGGPAAIAGPPCMPARVQTSIGNPNKAACWAEEYRRELPISCKQILAPASQCYYLWRGDGGRGNGTRERKIIARL